MKRALTALAIIITLLICYWSPSTGNRRNFFFPPDSGKKKYEDIFKCRLGLNCYFDYEEGLGVARKARKPLFIYFTGWAAPNCHKMEDVVWTDERVLKMLKNDYVLVSLYVDDKTELPDSEQHFSAIIKKTVKTIGNKNDEMEISMFNFNTQPIYILLDNNEKFLSKWRGYDTDVDTYLKFLNEGLSEFKKRNGK